MTRRLLIVAGAFLAVAGFGATRWALAEHDALSVGGKSADGREAWLEGREIPSPPILDVRDTPEYWGDVSDPLPRTTPLRTIYGAGWLLAGLGAACFSVAAFPRRSGGPGSP
jgi:hypothetical protein